jgi:hypothetical protein
MSKKIVYIPATKKNHGAEGFSLVSENGETPDHPEFQADEVKPTLTLELRQCSKFLGINQHTFDFEKNKVGKIEESEIIKGVASITGPDVWHHHDFVGCDMHFISCDSILFEKCDKVQLTIENSGDRQSTIGLFPSGEDVCVVLNLPKIHFDKVSEELENTTLEQSKIIQFSFSLDYDGLFFTFDPIGGEQRTILTLRNPEKDISNYQDIPEEFLKKNNLRSYMYYGPKNLPFSLGVTIDDEINEDVKGTQEVESFVLEDVKSEVKLLTSQIDCWSNQFEALEDKQYVIKEMKDQLDMLTEMLDIQLRETDLINQLGGRYQQIEQLMMESKSFKRQNGILTFLVIVSLLINFVN